MTFNKCDLIDNDGECEYYECFFYPPRHTLNGLFSKYVKYSI